MSARLDANAHSAFFRPLTVEEVPPEGLDVTISATEAERQAIAAADGLEGLAKLEGSLHVAPWRQDGLRVTGEMRARITQVCVVTLDPFDSEMVEPIDVKFAPEPAPHPGATAHPSGRSSRPYSRERLMPAVPAAKPDDADPPDPLVDGRIDLGALVTEFLALGLDPYPRKPGVAFEATPATAEPEAADGPFAQLKALKRDGARGG
jgi:hypothetical protein